jgi:hypothetical protein
MRRRRRRRHCSPIKIQKTFWNFGILNFAKIPIGNFGILKIQNSHGEFWNFEKPKFAHGNFGI